jgi:hypothetical protein
MALSDAERQRNFRERQRALANARPTTSLIRAATAACLTAHRGGYHRDSEKIIEAEWPHDRVAPLILRGASAPASMSTSGWAADLVQGTIVDFSLNTGPSTAGFTLLSRALQLEFGGKGVLVVPLTTPAANDVTFLGESGVIPVHQASYDSIALIPQKFATALAYNREVFEHSTPNIEKIIGASLLQAVGLQLDSILFGTGAATVSQPMGLRSGVAETAHEGTATGDEAMKKDIANLASAIAAVAGNGPIVLIAAPKTAVSLRLRKWPDFPFEILASSALTTGTVMAVAVNALVFAAAPSPRIESSIEAVINFEDSAPQNLVTSGTPGAGLSRSLFQTDAIALRLIWPMTWGARQSGAVSWTSGVTW